MDQETFEIASIFFGIISVVGLIAFFIMASNIAAIRKSLNKTIGRNHSHDFERAMAFGQKDAARQSLEYLVFKGWYNSVKQMKNTQVRQINLEALKSKYLKHLKNLGMEWPETFT